MPNALQLINKLQPPDGEECFISYNVVDDEFEICIDDKYFSLYGLYQIDEFADWLPSEARRLTGKS